MEWTRSPALVAGILGGVIRDIGYRQRVFRCRERSGPGHSEEVNYVREKYAGEPAGEYLACPAISRIPAAGQHRAARARLQRKNAALLAHFPAALALDLSQSWACSPTGYTRTVRAPDSEGTDRLHVSVVPESRPLLQIFRKVRHLPPSGSRIRLHMASKSLSPYAQTLRSAAPRQVCSASRGRLWPQ